MTAMNPLRPILNDTPANAVDVDWNFQTTEDFIATDVITRDGTTSMEAPLNLLGAPPSLPSHAVTKGYVDANIIPIATIWQFAGATAPAAWALCDGTEHSSTDPLWVPLFAVIGYTYGQNGTNFKLPDLRARVPVGRSAGDALFGTLGQQGGNRDTTGVGPHAHGMKNHNHALSSHTHDLSNHQHLTPAHQHYTDALTKSVTGGLGTRGGPSGWTGGINVLFGENLPLQGPTGRPYAVAPTDWFDRPLSVDVGGHWSRLGDGQIWTNQINNNTSGGPSNNLSGGPNDNTTDGVSGGASTNTNVQPYTTVNFIIRVG